MSPLKPLAMLAGAGLLIAADHDSDQAALAKALAGKVAGAPVDCIDPHWANGPTVIDQRTILYTSGGTVYKNDLPAACGSLSPTSTVIVELYGGQLCSHDRFRTREPGDVIPSQYCFFGKFTPYSKPKR